MLALHPLVTEAVFEAIEGLLPPRLFDAHPLGCHRKRIPDRVCFQGMLVRLVTGCSWDVAARLCRVGETTLRRRRDEWTRAGVFGRLVIEALEAYDRAIGLDLSEVSIDGSLHKAPSGGEGVGKNPTDRGKLGWKCSLATDANGIPIAWAPCAANRHDSKLLEETLAILDGRGYELECASVHLDRGYDFPFIREMLEESGIAAVIPLRRRPHAKSARDAKNARLGERWRVERANSWLSNFGLLRRNTDRKLIHREAALDLAVTLVLTTKLMKWNKRYGANFVAA
ncbi:MAG: IS5 family transposase [Acidimicrobiales bacterium]